MVKRLISSYFELLDEKLENGTLIVLLIAILVVLVSILINDLQLRKNYNTKVSTIEYNGNKYKLIEE
ncbi:MAG: hypothetical protein Q8K30_04365 [Candidatus Gracilibacteria bacterium]|nr:hypothetical protein [Candidatus Gracilibacteria bacterium]